MDNLEKLGAASKWPEFQKRVRKDSRNQVMIWSWIFYKKLIAPIITSVSNRWIQLLQFEWRFWKRKRWYLDLHLMMLFLSSARWQRRRCRTSMRRPSGTSRLWGCWCHWRVWKPATCMNRTWTELDLTAEIRSDGVRCFGIGTSCHLGEEALWMLTSLEQEFVVFWEDHEETVVWTTTRNLQL